MVLIMKKVLIFVDYRMQLISSSFMVLIMNYLLFIFLAGEGVELCHDVIHFGLKSEPGCVRKGR